MLVDGPERHRVQTALGRPLCLSLDRRGNKPLEALVAVMMARGPDRFFEWEVVQAGNTLPGVLVSS